MVRSATGSHGIEASQLLTALVSFMGAQDIVDELPGSVVDDLLSLPFVQSQNMRLIVTEIVHSVIFEAVEGSLQWANVEKVIIPMLRRIFKKHSESTHSTMLDLLLTRNAVPTVVLKSIFKWLLSDSDDTNMLSAAHQRYPDILRAAIEELVAEGKGSRNEFENLLLTTAMVRP